MTMTDCCYLEELLVAPIARKQGIARRLLQAIRAKAELPPLQPHLLGERQAAATGLRNSFTGNLPSNPTCCSSVMIWVKLFKAKAQLRS